MKNIKILQKIYVILLFVAAIFILSQISFAQDLNLDDLIGKIQENKAKIVDMYSEMKTTMTGQGKMSSMNSVQKARMWEKGDDMSKIEMLEPIKQTTIRNGDKLIIIDGSSGKKTVKDLSTDKFAASSSSQGKMDFNKMKEMFDLSVSANADTYIIACTPKNVGFIGKIEIYVDNKNFVSVKILTYDRNNKVINETAMEYTEISGIFVPQKTHSSVNSPMGKMTVDVEFLNIKVNEGIKDEEFRYEYK